MDGMTKSTIEDAKHECTCWACQKHGNCGHYRKCHCERCRWRYPPPKRDEHNRFTPKMVTIPGNKFNMTTQWHINKKPYPPIRVKHFHLTVPGGPLDYLVNGSVEGVVRPHARNYTCTIDHHNHRYSISKDVFSVLGAIYAALVVLKMCLWAGRKLRSHLAERKKKEESKDAEVVEVKDAEKEHPAPQTRWLDGTADVVDAIEATRPLASTPHGDIWKEFELQTLEPSVIV